MPEADGTGGSPAGAVGGRDEPTESWHTALLGLAGVLPDGLVALARGWLADGRHTDVARAVGFALVAGRFAGTGHLAELLRGWLDGGGGDSVSGSDGAAGGAGVDEPLDVDAAADLAAMLAHDGGKAAARGGQAPVPWRFYPSEPGAGQPWPHLPLDLTAAGTGGTVGSGGTVDAGDGAGTVVGTDRAMIEATRAETGACGLWRAWRVPPAEVPWPPPKRIYLVTVERRGELAAAAGRLQAALAAAGEPDPQVEVCPRGVPVPAYQRVARASGCLLWAREPAGAISVARVFDEVDALGGPRFAPDRPRLAGATAQRVAAYLDAGVPVLGTATTMADVVDPARGDVVPLTFRTDGRWVWTDTVGYYLRTHGLAPDADLLRHIDLVGRSGPADEVALHRVLVHLLGPEEPARAEPVWEVPAMGGALAASSGA
ncbi:hypothetical protein CC117_27385 [Parafrankia colletiae]|uniref:Uncharacterized protein n=1 Tax=Parafrankia colletiae TaxID=573497 RepID=A0A1S1Q7J8_9ACTN|nr:hypothetical protein [Parafrankia colletiae]OHV30843.1 hypothetical protein CC117_27385 [Parafrankia colletiae]